MTYRTPAEPDNSDMFKREDGLSVELDPELVGADTSSMAETITTLSDGESEERLSDSVRLLGGVFQACLECVRGYVYDHAFTILYVGMMVIAYGYLFITIGIFFLQKDLPKVFPNIIGSFSEPYLGVLGIFVLVQEMRRRQTERPRRIRDELFIVIWLVLLVSSTALTILSESYHFDSVYRLIITNSLAVTIIRIGAWLHF